MSVQQRNTGSSSHRDHRRAERRTQLLEAAVDAIRTRGPGVTMEQLAAAGGVTKPILYRHFGDRDGLIAAIAERFAADLLISVTRPLATDASDQDVLRATVDAYVGFIEREPNLYRFMVQTVPDRNGEVPQLRTLVDLIGRQVAAVTAARLQEAGRDPAAALPWAYGIVGLVHQAGDWWLEDRSMNRHTLVDHLVSLLWHGLGGAAPPPQAPA